LAAGSQEKRQVGDGERGDMPTGMFETMATPGVADLIEAYLTLDVRLRPALVELAQAMAPRSQEHRVLAGLAPTTRAAICKAIAARSRGCAAEAASPQEEAFYRELSVRWRRLATESAAAEGEASTGQEPASA
jgi:hypothetical protein